MRMYSDRSAHGTRDGLVLPFVLLLLLFALSVFIRTENLFQRPLLSHNEDATAHALFTSKAQAGGAPSIHAYLPIVTGVDESNRGIDNFKGASITDEKGNYFYVSFPPLGFALPTLILGGNSERVTLLNMRAISLVTGLLTVVGVFFLLIEILPSSTSSSATRGIIALFGASLYLFHAEALWSHGNIIWAHVLYQPILVFSCLLVAKCLSNPQQTLPFAGLIALMLLGCMIDWSAFLFAASTILIFAFWWRKSGNRRYLFLAAASAMVFVLSFVLILLHWSQVVSISEYLSALVRRPKDHGFSEVNIYETFPLILLFSFPFLVSALFLIRGRRASLTKCLNTKSLSVLFCFAFTTLETIVFLRHSTWYAYGMLKVILLQALLLAVLASCIYPYRMRRLAIVFFGCMLYGISLYKLINPADLQTTAFAAQYNELEKIKAYADSGNAVFINIEWPLGLELGRVERNMVSPPSLPNDFSMGQAQRYLAGLIGATEAELFIFSRDSTGDKPLLVWWPTTKSAILTQGPFRIGELLAVISFDTDQIHKIKLFDGAFVGRMVPTRSENRDIVAKVSRFFTEGLGPAFGPNDEILTIARSMNGGYSARPLKPEGGKKG